MKITNEESFIKNYFNKKRYFVYNEMDPTTMMLLTAIFGVVAHLVFKKIGEFESRKLKEYIDGPVENIKAESTAITNALEKSIETFKKNEKDLSPEDKNKLKELEGYLASLKENFKGNLNTPEAKEKIKTNISNAGDRMSELDESIVSKLDPKSNTTETIIKTLQQDRIDFGASFGTNVTQLQELVKKLIDSSKMNPEDKDRAKGIVDNEIKADEKSNRYSVNKFFEDQKIVKATPEEIKFKNYFEITKQKKTLNLNFSIQHYSLTQEKYDKIIKNLKDGFSINKSDAGNTNLFEADENSDDIEIGSQDKKSAPVTFTLYFSYEKKGDSITLKPFADTAKKFKDIIENKTSTTTPGAGAELRAKKYLFDMNEWTDISLVKNLTDYLSGKSYFTIRKRQDRMYINFYFEDTKYTLENVIKFKEKLKSKFYFESKNKENIVKVFTEKFFYREESEKKIVLKNFSLELKIIPETLSDGKTVDYFEPVFTTEQIDSLIPINGSGSPSGSSDLPAKLYYDLTKPLMVRSELTTSHTSQDAYVIFTKGNDDDEYTISQIEVPDDKKLDQVLLKSVLLFEAVLPIDKNGKIKVISKNGKFYVSEILGQASFTKADGALGKIKNFFNNPKDKFSNTSGAIVPLFSIGFQKPNDKSITRLREPLASKTKAEGTYWFLLRGVTDTAGSEYIVGYQMKLDKSDAKLIGAIKRISATLLKYNEQTNNFQTWKLQPVNGNAGLTFNFYPEYLKSEKIREKYLVDFQDMASFFKKLYIGDKATIPKTSQIAMGKFMKASSDFSFVKFGKAVSTKDANGQTIPGAWLGSFTAPEEVK